MAKITDQNTAQLDSATLSAFKERYVTQDMYKVKLFVSGDESLDSSGRRLFPMEANLPERFNIQLSSNWSTPLAKSDLASAITKFAGQGKGDIFSAFAGAVGFSTKIKANTAHIWDDSSPLTFSLDLQFNADTNTRTDVIDKQIALLKLCAPSEHVLGTLTAPGPTVFGQTFKGRTIKMQIGNYMKLDSVIVESVSSDVMTLLDKEGLPMSMSINISVKSFYAAFTVEDLDKAFNRG